MDYMGGVHSPPRRIRIKAAEFRQRTRDLDTDLLPHVNKVRDQLRKAGEFPDGAEEKASLRVDGPERKSTASQTPGVK